MLKKFSYIICMLAFTAGIFCFACGFTVPAVPKNVTVNGICVGGMSRTEALKTLRSDIESRLKEKTLKIYTEGGEYEYTFPEIYYRDNLYDIVNSAKKGKNYTAEVSYYLNGLEEVVNGICQSERLAVTEPYAEFLKTGKQPFAYFEGNDGKDIDKSKLKDDIRRSLEGDFEPVTASYVTVPRKGNMQQVKEATKLISRFTTFFDGDNLNRSSNIRLAASKLNGKVLGAGSTLSFNNTVGERSKSRGFLTAKIIVNGEFTEGVGGGVCQVSTTLYNAALLAGLEIAEYHPHSLAVSYVAPSRDAMVSGTACDLKIINTAKTPVFVRALTTRDSVTFEIYGTDDGAEYSISSQVVNTIPAEEENTDDPLKARAGKDGTVSEGYLVITRGQYKKTVLLRKDKYLPVKKVTYNDDNSKDSSLGESDGNVEDSADKNKAVIDP